MHVFTKVSFTLQCIKKPRLCHIHLQTFSIAAGPQEQTSEATEGRPVPLGLYDEIRINIAQHTEYY